MIWKLADDLSLIFQRKMKKNETKPCLRSIGFVLVKHEKEAWKGKSSLNDEVNGNKPIETLPFENSFNFEEKGLIFITVI